MQSEVHVKFPFPQNDAQVALPKSFPLHSSLSSILPFSQLFGANYNASPVLAAVRTIEGN